MHATVERALDTYTRLEVETGVSAASPQRLIVMLYEGAIKSLCSAKAALARGDVSARGAMISKAIAIIDDGLRPAVDPAAGGEIAQNLLALYEYMANRLLLANLKSDEASVDEVIALLSELKTAWDILERQSARQEPARSEDKPRAAAASRARV
jgi:flagellar protein FliS